MASRKTKKIGKFTIPKNMKIVDYIINDNIGKPKVHVTIGELNKIFCRGIALCSFSENEFGNTNLFEPKGFVESYGLSKSSNRMFKAFNHMCNREKVVRDEAKSVIESVCFNGKKSSFFVFKSAYDVRPTEQELLLFDNIELYRDIRKKIKHAYSSY